MAAELKEVELEQQALSVADEAKAIIIKDQISYDRAAEKLLGVRTLIKQIDETFDPDIKRWHEGHKAALATKKKVLGNLPFADATLVRLIGQWEIEQRRIREENDRKEREAALKREEDARLALALEAESHGAEEETVREILETPQPIQVQPSKPTFKPAAGLSSSRKPVYRWRTTNANMIPRGYLMIDEVKINGIVRAMGKQTQIPGIEVYEDIPNISVRTGR
jgi:hypothetical protein